MSIADYVIIGILAVAVIFGLFRGFWRTFSKALTLIIALCVGFLTATKLAPMMFTDDFLTTINGFFAQFIGTGETASGIVKVVGNEYFVATESGSYIAISEALSSMFIPKFLQAPIIASAASITGEITLGALVCSAYTHWTSILISAGVVSLGSLIVLRVIAKLIYNKLAYKKFHRAIDRILGGLLRIVTGGLFVLILLEICGMLSGFDFMQPVIEEIESGVISGPIFEADILNSTFFGEGLSKLSDIFSNILAYAGVEAPAITGLL